MKTQLLSLAVMLGVSATAFAADTKTYQVTGPVIATTNDAITVEKGKEKWEIGKDAGTKVSGDVKVGDKVTVMYRMTATSIEAKSGTAKPAKKK